MTHPPVQIAFIAVLAIGCVALAYVPPPVAAPDHAMAALALTVFTVAMLATGVVQDYVAALMFFTVATVAAIAPPAVIFSGFHSNAMWLVFGGLIIGTAAERTGLGRWVAQAVIQRLGQSYPRFITAVIGGGAILAFVIPSSIGRYAIMVPLVAAIAKESGYPAGSNRYVGAIAATVFAGFFVSLAILPANLINVIMLGAAENMHGVKVSYAEYLIMNMPVLGLLKALVIGWLVTVIYKPKEAPESPSIQPPAPLGDDGRKLSFLLVCALIAWSTDFHHGVAPGWIALTVALICVLPAIELVPPKVFAEKVNFVTVLFIAGVLGISAVLTQSGAGDLLATVMVDALQMEGRSPIYGYFAISFLSMVLPLVATLSGDVAITTALAGDIAAATGLDLKTAIMAQLNGMSSVLLPYAAAPLMIGLTFGAVPVVRTMKLLVWLSLITMAVLVPLNLLWWRWLGYVP